MADLAYFEQTKTEGDSRWWTWPTVFWLMIMTWIVGQLIAGIGMVVSAAFIDPEIMNQLVEASAADQATTTSFLTTLAPNVLLISSLLALVGLIIALTSEGSTRKNAGILTGIMIALSYLSMIILMPVAFGGGESTELLNGLMAASPAIYFFMLLTFPGALIGLYLGYKLIHKRTLTALHTGFKKFRWGRAIQAFFVMWVVLAGFSFLMDVIGQNKLNFVFDAKRFIGYAIISLLLLPIQSATEEIVFRGYMNQGLMHFLKNKWVVFTITSALFMAMHLANPEALAGKEGGILPIVMSGYFFFGFACCLMILMDDGLESAIGVHAGNNTFAALFVNYENSVLPTPSVYQIKADPVLDSITTIIVLAVVLGLLYVLKGRHKPIAT